MARILLVEKAGHADTSSFVSSNVKKVLDDATSEKWGTSRFDRIISAVAHPRNMPVKDAFAVLDAGIAAAQKEGWRVLTKPGFWARANVIARAPEDKDGSNSVEFATFADYQAWAKKNLKDGADYVADQISIPVRAGSES